MLRLQNNRTLTLLLVLAVILPSLAFSAVGPQAARGASYDLSKIDPALLEQMTADRTTLLPIILEMNAAKAPFSKSPAPDVMLALTALGLLQLNGRPVASLALIDSAVGFATADGIEAISNDPRVAYVHKDALVRPRPSSSTAQTTWQPGQLSAYPQVVRADSDWQLGITGKGIGVAVLDSGINPDPDLVQPSNRLVAAVNFAGDPGPLPDAGGHGTHVAGIIAGNGTRSAGQFVGIAPNANLIDVRVIGRTGTGRISSIVRGIEWVLAHQAQYNIRVLNLSFGALARHSYRLDPLAAAVEMAWRRGLVVVAAAGNGGPSGGTVETPGIDPYVITVGATDDQGSLIVSDDQLAWFSAWGTPTDSTPRPDLVAPGRRIVSLRSPGSYLDQLLPDRVVVANNGASYFRLTGTSMATPVVAGVVALMLERQPGLTPDQVKAMLVGTTQPYGQTSGSLLPDPAADGSGLVDAFAAANGTPGHPFKQGFRPSNSFARTIYPVIYGQRLVWKNPNYLGKDWNKLDWDKLDWDNAAWDNAAWDAFQWDNAAWDNAAWDNAAWDNAAWDNAAWDNAAWDSLTAD